MQIHRRRRLLWLHRWTQNDWCRVLAPMSLASVFDLLLDDKAQGHIQHEVQRTMDFLDSHNIPLLPWPCLESCLGRHRQFYDHNTITTITTRHGLIWVCTLANFNSFNEETMLALIDFGVVILVIKLPSIKKTTNHPTLPTYRYSRNKSSNEISDFWYLPPNCLHAYRASVLIVYKYSLPHIKHNWLLHIIHLKFCI